jgi:hypothetical protein
MRRAHTQNALDSLKEALIFLTSAIDGVSSSKGTRIFVKVLDPRQIIGSEGDRVVSLLSSKY